MTVLALTVGGAVVVLLAPGGLGDPQLQIVTDGASASTYRSVVGAAGKLPDWLHGPGEHVALAGVLLLVGLLGWTGWTGWRRRTPAVVGAGLVGVGALLAYLTSEGLKLVVDQERPCRAFDDVTTWVPCPPAGDWSFPSNHSTVAGALAAGLVVLAPRLGFVAVPVAGTVAAMRVVAGVHYPHDVLAGLLLGAATTVALLLALGPVGARIAAWLPGRGARVPGAR
ncbi:phosphatase PAP2 family protein [Micromonospora sp. HM5-17]|nr:phosphatase PAP2 family protein [Micromonospora sp. HM5-17]